MTRFVSVNLLRRAGLVVALATAVLTAMAGDFVTAGGLVAAALSSAGLKRSDDFHFYPAKSDDLLPD